MYPVIHIGEINIYTFNICVMIGFLVGIFVFEYRTKKIFKRDIQDSIIALIGADIPFVIIGAILYNKIAFSSNWDEFCSLIFRKTGIAFLGGLIGGIVGFVILYKVLVGKQVRMVEVTDQIVPSISIGHAFGRVGCLLGGCCFGYPSKFGIHFAEGTPAYLMYQGEKLFPTQLLEVGLLIILFVILLLVREHKTIVYIVGYSIIRLITECFRGDMRGNKVYFLSPSQLVCIALLIVICGVYFFRKANRNI